jgi:hypothetical protein
VEGVGHGGRGLGGEAPLFEFVLPLLPLPVLDRD